MSIGPSLHAQIDVPVQDIHTSRSVLTSMKAARIINCLYVAVPLLEEMCVEAKTKCLSLHKMEYTSPERVSVCVCVAVLLSLTGIVETTVYLSTSRATRG